MNRRLILGFLGIGLMIILSLGGFGLYKIHALKTQVQNLLNSKLKSYASQLEGGESSVHYKPFKCDGLIFVECKSEKISLQSVLFEEKILEFKNVVFKADDIDFNGITFVVSSGIVAPQIDGIEEYIQALFPYKFNLCLKLAMKNEESYEVDARLVFEANNIDYQEEFNATVFSPELKEKGFFHSIEDFNFLQERMELKNMIITLTSKDLSEEIYRIIKNKYGGLGKKEYRGLANLMIGASMMQFEGSKEMQEIISGAGSLVLGDAQKMKIYMRAKDGILLSQDFVDGDTNQILQVLSERYDFETKLEK